MSHPTTAATHRRKDIARKREIRKAMRGENAARAIGELSSGCEIYGLTKGQFSLSDLVRAILDQTGAADVQVATWTAAKADIRVAYNLLKNGNIRSIRFLVDRSFPTRQPDYCKALIDHFGADAVRVTRSHAKFVLIRNEAWDLVVRTSMNLNENPRVENFEISDDAAMADFMQAVIDEVWAMPEAWAEQNFEALGGKPEQSALEFDVREGLLG